MVVYFDKVVKFLSLLSHNKNNNITMNTPKKRKDAAVVDANRAAKERKQREEKEKAEEAEERRRKNAEKKDQELKKYVLM